MSDEAKRALTRRHLLRAGAIAAPAGLLALRPWRTLVDVEPASAAVRLVAAVRDRDSARAVGAAYLRSHALDAASATTALRKRLAAHGTPLERTGHDDLRVALAACVTEDFRAATTESVAGWVLARTEAQLCALTELLARRR